MKKCTIVTIVQICKYICVKEIRKKEEMSKKYERKKIKLIIINYNKKYSWNQFLEIK